MIESESQPESTSEPENTEESESESESENETKKMIAKINPLEKDVISVYYSDYMKNGQQKYIDSLLPDTVTVVYDDGSNGIVDAAWEEEIPFGSKGKGDYIYKLDVSKYKITEDFDIGSMPKLTLEQS